MKLTRSELETALKLFSAWCIDRGVQFSDPAMEGEGMTEQEEWEYLIEDACGDLTETEDAGSEE